MSVASVLNDNEQVYREFELCLHGLHPCSTNAFLSEWGTCSKSQVSQLHCTGFLAVWNAQFCETDALKWKPAPAVAVVSGTPLTNIDPPESVSERILVFEPLPALPSMYPSWFRDFYDVSGFSTPIICQPKPNILVTVGCLP